MKMTGVADLKATLSQCLTWVKAGEEVLITERGRPIARIIPLSAASESSVHELVRKGLIRPPARPLDAAFWRLPRPADRRGAAVAALLAEREDAR